MGDEEKKLNIRATRRQFLITIGSGAGLVGLSLLRASQPWFDERRNPQENTLKLIPFAGCGLVHEFSQRKPASGVGVSLEGRPGERNEIIRAYAATYSTSTDAIRQTVPGIDNLPEGESVTIPRTEPATVETHNGVEYMSLVLPLVTDLRDCNNLFKVVTDVVNVNDMRRAKNLFMHTQNEIGAVIPPTDVSSGQNWSAVQKSLQKFFSNKIKALSAGVESKISKRALQGQASASWYEKFANQARQELLGGDSEFVDPYVQELIKILSPQEEHVSPVPVS